MTKRQGYFLIGSIWLLIASQFEDCATMKHHIAFLLTMGIGGAWLGKGLDTKDT